MILGLSLAQTFQVASLIVNRGSASPKTVYVIDDASRADLTGKLFAQENVFTGQSTRTTSPSAQFVEKLALCSAPTYEDNCYVKINQETKTESDRDAVMAVVNNLLQTLGAEYNVVYTSNSALETKIQVNNFFATGMLWSTILVLLVLVAYLAVSACPALSVEEPMDIPKGEEQ